MTNTYAFAGDWHVDLGWALQMVEKLAKAGHKHVYHVGDFGVWAGNDGAKYLRRLQTALTKHDMTLFVTLGNHENYHMVNNWVLDSKENPHAEFPEWVWDGKHDRILYAHRGQRWTENGVSFMSLGGANSIDKADRVEHISWWAEEQISYGDAYRASQGGRVDVMITHDTPTGVPIVEDMPEDAPGNLWRPEDLAYAAGSREMLRYVTDVTQPKVLVHGHYHRGVIHEVKLDTPEGDEYTMKSVCLDMNGHQKNLGVLNLEDFGFEFIQ